MIYKLQVTFHYYHKIAKGPVKKKRRDNIRYGVPEVPRGTDNVTVGSAREGLRANAYWQCTHKLTHGNQLSRNGDRSHESRAGPATLRPHELTAMRRFEVAGPSNHVSSSYIYRTFYAVGEQVGGGVFGRTIGQIASCIPSICRRCKLE